MKDFGKYLSRKEITYEEFSIFQTKFINKIFYKIG